MNTKIMLIILIGFCILLIGCSYIQFSCTVGWSNETHFCNEYYNYEEKYIEKNTNIFNIGNMTTIFNLKNMTINTTSNIRGENTYCYADNSKGGHCICDIIIYPDGHNESRNCDCWNNLVVYMTCINSTNLTIIKDVKIY